MIPACPACGVAMESITWHKLTGFECPRCRGHFIRAKQLETFLEKNGPDKFGAFVVLSRGASGSPRPLTCPGCATNSFRALRRGMVEIDVCATCSAVYFDEGEATLYLRQALVRKYGEGVMMTTVDSADVFASLLELILDLLN